MMERKIIIMFFPVLLLFCGSSGCERGVKYEPGNVSFSTIERGDQSGMQSRGQAVITTKQEYDKLMSQLGSIYSPAPVYTEVDFNNYMVIGVFMGMQRSGGFGTAVEKITETSAELNITVKETSPGINCMVTDVMTYPFHIIMIRKINKKVEYSFEQVVQACN